MVLRSVRVAVEPTVNVSQPENLGVERVRCKRPTLEEIGDVIGPVAYFRIAPLSKGVVTPMQKEQYGVPA